MARRQSLWPASIAALLAVGDGVFAGADMQPAGSAQPAGSIQSAGSVDQIARHTVQGDASRRTYLALSPGEQTQLLIFLNSL